MTDWLWELVLRFAEGVNQTLTVSMFFLAFVPPMLGLLCRVAHRKTRPGKSGLSKQLSAFRRDNVKRWLALFRDFGPPLGLFGTVLGMMHALSGFSDPSATATSTVGRLAPALLTTVFGLVWLLGAGLGRAIADIAEE